MVLVEINTGIETAMQQIEIRVRGQIKQELVGLVRWPHSYP